MNTNTLVMLSLPLTTSWSSGLSGIKVQGYSTKAHVYVYDLDLDAFSAYYDVSTPGVDGSLGFDVAVFTNPFWLDHTGDYSGFSKVSVRH